MIDYNYNFDNFSYDDLDGGDYEYLYDTFNSMDQYDQEDSEDYLFW